MEMYNSKNNLSTIPQLASFLHKALCLSVQMGSLCVICITLCRGEGLSSLLCWTQSLHQALLLPHPSGCSIIGPLMGTDSLSHLEQFKYSIWGVSDFEKSCGVSWDLGRDG